MNKETASAPKTMFLTLIILALIVFALFTLGREYYDFTQTLPQGGAEAAPPPPASDPKQYDTEVKFRKFFITAPGAKQVELIADFNNWGEQPIEFKEYNKSYFDVTVALASGEYKYLFLVDGKEVVDGTNKDRAQFNGREVCIKTVK